MFHYKKENAGAGMHIPGPGIFFILDKIYFQIVARATDFFLPPEYNKAVIKLQNEFLGKEIRI